MTSSKSARRRRRNRAAVDAQRPQFPERYDDQPLDDPAAETAPDPAGPQPDSPPSPAPSPARKPIPLTPDEMRELVELRRSLDRLNKLFNSRAAEIAQSHGIETDDPNQGRWNLNLETFLFEPIE